MPGLENAHILRPGYAIEYDYFDPRSLKGSFDALAYVENFAPYTERSKDQIRYLQVLRCAAPPCDRAGC